jgi:chloride channel 3/4/5
VAQSPHTPRVRSNMDSSQRGRCVAREVSISWLYSRAVGALIGVNAAVISIVTEWLSDMKLGYCYDAWWLNEQFCCWEVGSTEGSPCDSWHPWSSVTAARFFIYVLCAVCGRYFSTFACLCLIFDQGSFAFIAAHLVRTIAKYAAGSGISEIKCIIAGFVMRGFLGFWTFLIKSLTLVR